MCYPMGGTLNGRDGDHLLLAPPFIATDADLETIVTRLGEAIDASLAECLPKAA
jgi:adenosylmethionine-8-amino-7-oxononanoate aminotransferase